MADWHVPDLQETGLADSVRVYSRTQEIAEQPRGCRRRAGASLSGSRPCIARSDSDPSGPSLRSPVGE